MFERLFVQGCVEKAKLQAMLAALGKGLYRTTTVLAAIIFAIVLAILLYSAAHGDPYLQFTALLIAGFIWLVGRIGKLVLAGQ